jgi:quinol monooxygenase YgiN
VVTEAAWSATVGVMAVVEFIRFAISEDQRDALVAAHSALTSAFADAHAGFQRSCLVQVGAGEWVDITVWDDEAAADAAMVRSSETSGYFELIDRILGQERGMTIPEDSGAG